MRVVSEYTQCNTSIPTCCFGNCTNLNNDPSHCGSCSASPCQGTIPACCSGVCDDLYKSSLHCGSCSVTVSQETLKIPITGAQSDIHLLIKCGPSASTCCAGNCTNLNTDPNNCGACAAPPCTGLSPNCCGGNCTNVNNDPNHCGSCTASPCPGVNPACCSGVCADLSTSPLRCGSCNTSVRNIFLDKQFILTSEVPGFVSHLLFRNMHQSQHRHEPLRLLCSCTMHRAKASLLRWLLHRPIQQFIAMWIVQYQCMLSTSSLNFLASSHV